MFFCNLLKWDPNNISAVASAAAALIAAFALWAGWYQIKKINRRNEYDTYNQVKKDIDSDFVRQLIKAIKDASIELVTATPVTPDSKKTYILGSDLTSKFLDHVEDLYIFYSKGLISREIIDAGFGYKILIVGNNDKVEEFIDKLRTINDDNNLYAGFHELYQVIYSKLSKHQKGNFREDIL